MHIPVQGPISPSAVKPSGLELFQGDALASLVIGSLLAILTVDVTGHVTRPTPSLAAMFVFSRPRIGVGGWDAGGIS